MKVVHVVNVIGALRWGVERFQEVEADERNIVKPRGAPTIEHPEPVCTEYLKPTERVLLSPSRDANPFFHFFEGLWMLAGRNDLAFLLRLNKQIAAYSDDGERIWGAYGWRWRDFFGFDQLREVVRLLTSDPDSRRGVVTMWDPRGDVLGNTGKWIGLGRATEGGPTGKDIPCNTHLYFKIRRDQLHMTICNRSNDMVWGAYGANAVHMSMLQEYIACKLGVGVGVMRQVSDSLHVYLPPHRGGEIWAKMKAAFAENPSEFSDDPYRYRFSPFPMGAHHRDWDEDLEHFLKIIDVGLMPYPAAFETEFFQRVATPLWLAWETRDEKILEGCTAPDWRQAATEWIKRRKNAASALDVPL